jgi:hypothetical protein
MNMASALGELELEGLGELEGEFEHEFEHEMPEMFGWDDVSNWASNQWNAIKTPGSWQNSAVRAADRAILAAAPSIGSAMGGSTGGDLGKATQDAGTAVIPPEWRESEFESEFETEFEHEGLGEISPVTRVYPDAMMEDRGQSGAEGESEHEAAEGFLPLIPVVASKLLPIAAKALPKIAGKLLPRVARTVSRVTPHLTRSVGNLTRTLYRNPRTRPLLRVVPSIARRAVTSIARRAAAGRPVTPRQAVRIMAQQNHRVLSSPQIVNGVLRRSQVMDGRYHRLAGIPAFGRNYRWRWRNGVWQPGTPGGPAGPATIAGPMRGCPTCGSTVVHARGGGPGCSVVVVR